MATKLTNKQQLVLLQTYAGQIDGGWTPDTFENNSEIRTARRLVELGLLVAQAAEDATYVLTAAGRAALGIDTLKPPKQLRAAVRRGLAWQGLDVDAWEILIGRQLPVIRLDEGTANYRGCRFAMREIDNDYGQVVGFLRALAIFDPEAQWQALAQYLTDLGFPVYYEGPDFGGVIGFWPREEVGDGGP